MPTLRTVPLMDVIPAPRMPAEDSAPAPRPRSHPAEEYWSVFEACWVVVKALVPSAGS
jgi:hypothetical protein